MVVIADASPLNYLVLINQIGLLPRLFSEVFVPDAVLEELSRPEAPQAVAQWVASSPVWVRPVPNESLLAGYTETLGAGETAAILFAERMRPDVLLVIDDAKGRRAARARHIPIVGILGILERAATQDWISLPTAIDALQNTNFRINPGLIAELLQRDRSRKATGKLPKETR
jgi:predicted nucleic acid-binding protein